MRLPTCPSYAVEPAGRANQALIPGQVGPETAQRSWVCMEVKSGQAGTHSKQRRETSRIPSKEFFL